MLYFFAWCNLLLVFYIRSIYLSIYLSICLSIYLYYLSIGLYVYLSIYLSTYLSIHPSVRPSVCLSVCLSIYLYYLSIGLYVYLSIHLSIYLSVFLSVYLFIYLSICLFIYLFSHRCFLVGEPRVVENLRCSEATAGIRVEKSADHVSAFWKRLQKPLSHSSTIAKLLVGLLDSVVFNVCIQAPFHPTTPYFMELTLNEYVAGMELASCAELWARHATIPVRGGGIVAWRAQCVCAEG